MKHLVIIGLIMAAGCQESPEVKRQRNIDQAWEEVARAQKELEEVKQANKQMEAAVGDLNKLNKDIDRLTQKSAAKVSDGNK